MKSLWAHFFLIAKINFLLFAPFLCQADDLEQFVAIDRTNGQFPEVIKNELDQKNVKYKFLTNPITKDQLDGASILLLCGPFRGTMEKPNLMLKNHKLYSEDEIGVIKGFVTRGGFLIGAANLWVWVSPSYGNKKEADHPLMQIGKSLSFSLVNNYSKLTRYEKAFNLIVETPNTDNGMVWSDVKMAGEYDKLIRSTNGYCGLGAKRYSGYIYVFGHEGILIHNPSFVSSLFISLSPKKFNNNQTDIQKREDSEGFMIDQNENFITEGAATEEIAKLDNQFLLGIQKIEHSLERLLDMYQDKLRVDKLYFQKMGDLAAVLAYQEEIEKLNDAHSYQLIDDNPRHSSLVKSRKQYDTQLNRLKNENFKKAIILTQKYAESLNALVVESTRTGNIDKAVAYNARLNSVKLNILSKNARGAPKGSLTEWIKDCLNIVDSNESTSDSESKDYRSRAGSVRKIKIAPGVYAEFCWCPPGEFVMGSPTWETGREDRENQVNTRFNRGFWIGKTEVTQEHWQCIMRYNPSHFKHIKNPVEMVSWNDAQKYVDKLNGKRILPANLKFAIPTEAQWEYACRAGEKGPFSGGTIDEIAWYDRNSDGKTHEVASKKPNAWGIYDMHGNVWEWCGDWYSVQHVGGLNPQGPASGTLKVDHGGGWSHPASYCRSAHRYALEPNFVDNVLGFRLAIVYSE